MTFAIAAAGTGGHVFPGLAVGEALVELGVDRSQVLFVGGDRLEASVFPEAGFAFVQVEVRGLQRRLTPANLAVPWLVIKARRALMATFRERGVKAALGLGNYVTVPFGWAAHAQRIPFFVAEQNVSAGLGNKIARRWARDAFVSFPETEGLAPHTVTGNPIRRDLATFDRQALRPEALAHYGLDPSVPTIGVFGGSLGAGVINEATRRMVAEWAGPRIQVLHLVGSRNAEEVARSAAQTDTGPPWVVIGFETRMELFFAAADLIVARAGGGVAEVTATATPAILIPGGFGSGGHQGANAAAVADAGAAVLLPESSLERLGTTVRELIEDPDRTKAMATAARAYAHPNAAQTIATRLMEAAGV